MRVYRAPLAFAVALWLTGLAAPRPAEGAARCRSGVAQVRAGERAVWCAPSPGVELAAEPVWSESGRAVAFVTRGRRGELTLVVVLVGGDVDGHAMRWPVPEEARGPARAARPRVTWLGEQRVGFGYSPIRPALVASWRLRST